MAGSSASGNTANIPTGQPANTNASNTATGTTSLKAAFDEASKKLGIKVAYSGKYIYLPISCIDGEEAVKKAKEKCAQASGGKVPPTNNGTVPASSTKKALPPSSDPNIA